MATRNVSIGVDLSRPRIDIKPERAAAMLGLVLTSAVSLTVLYRITTELGGTLRLGIHVVAAVALAWFVATRLTERAAAVTFGALVVGGYFWYFAIVADDITLLVEAPAMIAVHTIDDAISIATGRSVLAIGATDVWAHSFAPAPLFLIWYFGFRRRYVTAAGIAGATMLLFVFSGDLSQWTTLLGTIGIVATVGFGTIELANAPRQYSEWLLVLITAMVVVALLLPLVPSGGAFGPLTIVDSDDQPTLESALIGSGDQIEIIGEINMDPEVRYVVDSDEQAYLRTAVYDYYTGSGWERTGESEPFSVPDPADRERMTDRVSQEITALTDTTELPSAGTLVYAAGISNSRLERDDHGVVSVPDGLDEGETYRAISTVPRQPDGTAPTTSGDVDQRYLQLPDDVPDELYEFTHDLVDGAEGPHEKAERIVTFLRSEKSYAHDVSVPSGDLASGFLFDMEAGYCTYFATTAVVMLRAVDVPARLAVGYTSGQQINESTSVVRGMNSHAWPEVYIDEHGWVEYEPTPGASWNDLRSDLLEEAREDGVEGVDTDESADLPLDHDPTPERNQTIDDGNQTAPDIGNGNVSEPGVPDSRDDPGLITDPLRGNPAIAPPPGDTPTNRSPDDFPDLMDYRAAAEADGDGDDGVVGGFEMEELGAFAALLLGVAVGARRYEVPRRLRRQRRLRWQLTGSGSPTADLTRSADRLEWAMKQRFRPRRPGETLRTYHRRYRVLHDDPTADDLFEVVERAKYAGTTDPDLAAESVALANQLVDDTVVFGGRLRPTIPGGPGSLADRIL